MGIHSDSFPISSYPSQITLYRSLYTHWQLILESTIQKISYLGFLSIMTGAGTSCILSEKVLNVVGLLQTSFSLYLHNQWTNFHKLSCAGKPQMRAIHTYVGGTKATTNN